MEKVIFWVEESKEGGFVAKGLGVTIFTQAETREALRDMVKDTVQCHYDDGKRRIIRLHTVHGTVVRRI